MKREDVLNGWAEKVLPDEILGEDLMRMIERFRSSHPGFTLGEALVGMVEEYLRL